MRISNDHWLTGARRAPSPNQNPRPVHPGAGPEPVIDLVVLHSISLPPGRFGGPAIEELFGNRLATDADPDYASLAGLRVSAHLLIRRRGGVVQFVGFDRRAWHAGVSGWRGRPGCNDYSIGIELEGCDHRPFTESQYRRLIAVLRALLDRYPRLAADAIVGHLEVAPGRKTDPGPLFDWRRVLRALASVRI